MPSSHPRYFGHGIKKGLKDSYKLPSAAEPKAIVAVTRVIAEMRGTHSRIRGVVEAPPTKHNAISWRSSIIMINTTNTLARTSR